MAPSNVTKKNVQLKKKKLTKKSSKLVSKHVETNSDSNNDSDGSMDAIQFDSESDNASLNDSEDGEVYDSDGLDEEVEKLKTSDPEFYKYLKECDKNLTKITDDGEDNDDDYDEDDIEGIKSEKLHKPPENLEVGSDESDFDEGPSNEGRDVVVITLSMIQIWREKLQNSKQKLSYITAATKAMTAALQRVTPIEINKPTPYKVEGSSVFNGVLQMCMFDLHPAILKFLKLPLGSPSQIMISKSKQWKKVKMTLRSYLTDLTKLLNNVSSEDISCVLLKHFHQMIPFLSCLPTIVKPGLKRLIALWSASESETVKVLAFLCLLKLANSDTSVYLEMVLKAMYVGYIANSKFVTPNSLPGINFMRQSLAEMFIISEPVSYNHAFLYIRQLAIHLRSAVTLKKKENIQSVYNWQYVSSLKLWVDVLCSSLNKKQLQTLVYPLIQIIIGCTKLISTVQYLPLRFHCISMLTKISKETGKFIPILPHILEVLSIVDFQKKHSKTSMRPMDFTCILRLSKSQLQENVFKDAVIESVHGTLMEYLVIEAHTISFPDLVVPFIIKMKEFLKNCKNINYTRKLRTLLDKVKETSTFISEKRGKSGISLYDLKSIEVWEADIKLSGTPMSQYYDSWFKLNQQQVARKITNNIVLGEFNIPTLKKHRLKKNDDGPAELFPSDDEEYEPNFGSSEDEDVGEKYEDVGEKEEN
ncbi:Armadillo-type fold,Armadillo-like helical,Nucleolar complex protein 2 [Cinara cedri]|uniref:Armadillo-type fold,Armadillo-like helical,Nucleolar complex protein 2 n=1 Tax=Cinara cedri TaxID=506608 RepID=A0A5E4MVE9_9HEMI|nr:Armadillo-type fold,Armadillo-like helical,Nucleolar complex protein 2 [Cinara cedri]